MAQLNILLGAGFSKSAGLPLVGDFNPYFNRDVTDKILVHSSGEWFWRDQADYAAIDNGSLPTDHFVFGFAFQEVLKKYNKVSNYEDLYDFLTKSDSAFYKTCFDLGKQELQKKLKLADDHDLLNPFHWDQYHKIIEMFNCLIIDLLGVPEINSGILDQYKRFFLMIEKYDQVRIFSLNHDLLLEELLQTHNIKFSDGFSEKDSILIGEQDVPQRIFQDDFCENVNFYKLHGSAGLYGYQVAKEEGSVLQRTGELIYFKANSYGSKHYAMRKDPDTGKIVQTHNIDVTPKFITGKNKNELIKDGNMYSKLFDHFRQEQNVAAELLVIGYSYGDGHVNEIINSAKFKKVTNVNPGCSYQYSNADKIINRKFIPEL